MTMHCLDTYALIEIFKGNPRFTPLFDDPFIITTWTFVEFYKTLLRDYGAEMAMPWIQRVKQHSFDVDIELLIQAVQFHFQHRKENLSLFDAIGYTYSLHSHFLFVTGDKAFKDREGVLFLQK